MLKKEIRYTDFNGQERVEDFYFNLSASELAEMEFSHKDGFESFIQGIVASENGGALLTVMKEIIVKTYGVREEGGTHFYKSEKIANDFLNSLAYDTMFMEFLTKPETLADFILGVLPEKLRGKAALAMTQDAPDEDKPAWIKEDREPTKTELMNMSKDQLVDAMRKTLSDKEKAAAAKA